MNSNFQTIIVYSALLIRMQINPSSILIKQFLKLKYAKIKQFTTFIFKPWNSNLKMLLLKILIYKFLLTLDRQIRTRFAALEYFRNFSKH